MRHRTSCLAGRTAASLVLLALASVAQAGDWPRWRGPNLDGISQEKDWTTNWPGGAPKELWRASVSTGFSSVVVSQGRVFTLGNSNEVDSVFCFDAAAGKLRWKFEYPCPLDAQYYEGGPGSTPTVDGERVFTLSKRGHLFCFEAASGRVVWKKDLTQELGVKKPRWGFAGSPLVEGEMLVLNVGSAGTAVNKATGKIIWTSNPTESGYATPLPYSLQNERGVVIFGAKALIGVRAGTGEELWRYPWVTHWDINAPQPVLAGNRLFVSSFDGGCALLQLGPNPPSVVWQNKNMANHFNACILLDGYLYGVNGQTDEPPRDLRCIALANGEIKWRYEGLGLGSLTEADGKLIVLSDKGELVVAPASPNGFEPSVRVQVLGGKCWIVPVLANGRLYCRNAQGTLICLDLKASGGAQ